MEGIRGAQKERLPTVEAANKVIWVNDHMKMPFDIRLGESSRLGVLVALGGEKDKGFPGIPREYHWRTLDIGQVYFEDTEHHLYRDVDMKGTGLLGGDLDDKDGLEPTQWFAKWKSSKEITMDVRGLLDKDEALRDAEAAERFALLGMRTHRALAVVELEELNIDEQMFPLDILKQGEALPADFIPAVEVRAFGVKTRVGDVFALRRNPRLSATEYLAQLRSRNIDDLLSREAIETAERELTDALGFLEKERGTPFTKEEYARWFAGELGRNLGLMHNAGYVHQWLHSQNVTLDCRVTDFDDVYRLADIESNPNLSQAEKRDEQETLLFNDVNFAPYEGSNRHGVLAWLESFTVMLQKLYPEELKDFDTRETNTLFFKEYWDQLADEKMRSTVRMFMEGNGIPVPEDAP